MKRPFGLFVALLSLAVTATAQRPSQPAQPPLPAIYNDAPPDVREIMQRVMKGEQINAADSVKASKFTKQATIASFGPLPPETKALVEKMLDGRTLTSDEQRTVSQAMLAKQLKAAPLPADVKQAIQGAASGQSAQTTAAQVKAIETRSREQARDLASRADAAMNPCPVVGAEPQSAQAIATAAQLSALLRDLVRVYVAQIGAPMAAALARNASVGSGAGLWMVGQVKPAIVAFAQAALANPTPRGLNNLGAALNNDGDYRRAQLVLGAANQAAPGEPAILTNLGIAYVGLGQPDRAAAQLRAALAVQPGLAQARFDLSTVIRCGSGGSAGAAGGASASAAAAASAVAEAERGQTDWFSASEDAAITLERAAAGMPVSGDAAESQYTPKRPKLMTLGQPIPDPDSPGGGVAKPALPGSLDEFVGIWQAGTLIKQMKVFAASAKTWNGEAAALRSQYSRARQAWLAGASASQIRMPADNNAAMIGLARRRGKMMAETGKSNNLEDRDIEPVALRLKQAWDSAIAEGGGTKAACAKILPVAREAYAIARGAVSANANRVDMAMQDYAKDAAVWIGQLGSPLLADAARDQIAGDADAASAETFLDATVRPEAVISALLCAGSQNSQADAADAKSRAKKKPGACKLPAPPPLKLGVLTMSVSCDGAEFGVEAGLALTLKLNSKTRAGTIFFGAGAQVTSGFDTPITSMGKVATGASGQLSAEGKAGMIFKFDGGGLTDAGFEFGMQAGSSKSSVNLQTDITIVGGLQLSPDMMKGLDAIDNKVWGPPSGAAATKPPEAGRR